ncbi:hypothetical protein E0Z10_g6141 [Xylaria hypoxylon]|uniref:Uncharacterized protein n=1 Tax=Xylaria hypoxylon TaxID=37992 RepID=A0A4Z0YGV9_9PEZI|nr:hypothetical protein E0Z10_g6141 [Xylaria hypoxylon]
MSPYEPLKQEVDDDEALSDSLGLPTDKDVYSNFKRRHSTTIFRHWPVGEVALVLLVLSNVAWILTSLPRQQSTPRDMDYYEGIGGVRYADDRWKDMIPPGQGSVSVSEDFASKYGFAPGAKSTQREGEMHYLIAGYHQLHCLSVIRDQLYEPVGLTSQPTKRDHVLHCVEVIRQALYCFLDPTLINLDREWPHVPNGQKHVCRNRDALALWAAAQGSPMPGVED